MDVAHIIRLNMPNLTKPDFTPECSLKDIGCDDLAIHGIALDVGDEIGQDIPDDVSSKWETVGDVMRAAGEQVDG